MTDEELPNGTGEEVAPAGDPLDTIKELKNKLAGQKAENEKLTAERNRLLSEFVNEQKADEVPTEIVATQEQVQKCREELFDTTKSDTTRMSNLEVAKKILELRKNAMSRGDKDPIVPFSRETQTSQQNIDDGEKFANILQHCVDVSEGDSARFQLEFKKIMGIR